MFLNFDLLLTQFIKIDDLNIVICIIVYRIMSALEHIFCMHYIAICFQYFFEKQIFS